MPVGLPRRERLGLCLALAALLREGLGRPHQDRRLLPAPDSRRVRPRQPGPEDRGLGRPGAEAALRAGQRAVGLRGLEVQAGPGPEAAASVVRAERGHAASEAAAHSHRPELLRAGARDETRPQKSTGQAEEGLGQLRQHAREAPGRLAVVLRGPAQDERRPEALGDVRNQEDEEQRAEQPPPRRVLRARRGAPLRGGAPREWPGHASAVGGPVPRLRAHRPGRAARRPVPTRRRAGRAVLDAGHVAPLGFRVRSPGGDSAERLGSPHAGPLEAFNRERPARGDGQVGEEQ
mmetsp:Transcript_12840/g.34003  ORF Transcript_12840/g.34003 Transcript_12840/m.34003 type:complete len:291 (-) Transcript_12840:58-930(-)